MVAPVFRRFASDDGITENDYQSGRHDQSSTSDSSISSAERSDNDYQTGRNEEQSAFSTSSLSSEEQPYSSPAAESAFETDSSYPSDVAQSSTTPEKTTKDTLVDIAQDVFQDAAAVASSFTPRESRRETASRDRYQTGRNFERTGSQGSELVLPPSPGVYVGNLLFEVTEDDLSRVFAEYGNIKSVKIATDARGLSKG